MAITLNAKSPTAALRYSWVPAVAAGDGIASATVVRTSGTISVQDYAVDGDAVVIILSGGTEGETGVLTAEVVTSDGEVLTETLYAPVRSSANVAGDTARDVCAFAIQKIIGIGETPDADQLDLVLTILNDMLAEWRIDGLDVGIPAPLTANTAIVVRDEFLSAIKYNLRQRAFEEFGADLTPSIVDAARRGRRLVENALFTIKPLSFEGPCIRHDAPEQI